MFENFKDKTFIIAEIGSNFEGDLARAREMIFAAAKAGADAVKFQTFIPEKLATKSAEKFWDVAGCPGATQLEEFIATPRLTFEQYLELKKEAEKWGLLFFSTPSDEDSADMLDRIGVPLYKISSMDITHLPLLQHVAMKDKPIILSTGASNIREIEDAVRAIEDVSDCEIVLLHCISNYPTLDHNVNLRMIVHLHEKFPEFTIGYSDHTIPHAGEGILTAAVALGARVLEKHFTFDNTRAGYDHELSANYEQLRELVTQVRRTENALGSCHKVPVPAEMKARLHARRSVVAASFIPAGTSISREMLTIKRPGTGLAPKYLEWVISKISKIDLSPDTVLTKEMFN